MFTYEVPRPRGVRRRRGRGARRAPPGLLIRNHDNNIHINSNNTIIMITIIIMCFPIIVYTIYI